MSVPFLDLRASYLELKEEIGAAVTRVLESGWYILGPEVEAFEAEFAAYCGAAYAVSVGNGLDALQLALLAMGVRAGDEVIGRAEEVGDGGATLAGVAAFEGGGGPVVRHGPNIGPAE